ncbi:MAG: MBL fold metallo-hydrolase, partial [Ignavibacteria bacterium]
IDIFETPGHTDGSLSFLIDGKALICGDLLLLESVGRPDLARSEEETIKGAEKLYSTLQNVLFKLYDKVKILPSHFISSTLRPVTMTLGELKKNNKSLTISDKDEFVKYITGSMPKTPPNYESIKKFNKTGTIIPLDYAEELEIGPNRCAARN